jgi:hypothetical protein
MPKNYRCTGIDFVQGKEVDIVIGASYVLSFKNAEADTNFGTGTFNPDTPTL